MKGREDIFSSSFGGKDSEGILYARAGTMLMSSFPLQFGKKRADTSHADIFVLFWRTKSIWRGGEEEDERKSRFIYPTNWKLARAQHVARSVVFVQRGTSDLLVLSHRQNMG